MLAYTIERTFDQQVVFERDQAFEDDYGAESARDWRVLSQVPCKSWWQKQSARGPAHEEATGSEAVLITDGGLMISGETDVTTADRIAEILDANGETVIAGPLHIVAVLPYATSPRVTEITFKQPA